MTAARLWHVTVRHPDGARLSTRCGQRWADTATDAANAAVQGLPMAPCHYRVSVAPSGADTQDREGRAGR